VESVIVLGAYGLLGESLCACLTERGYVVARQGRREGANLRCDPRDVSALARAIREINPSAIVNLIAATNVDACEEDPRSAYTANVAPLEALEAAIQGLDWAVHPHIVHVSTDQLYDGPGLHVEHVHAPVNVYALSKLAGEFVAERLGATTLRTNFFGRSRSADRQSLSDWVVSSIRRGDRITVFDDVFFSAWHINTLCGVIGDAIALRAPGVFNAGSTNGMSKADFAIELARVLNLDIGTMGIGKSTAARFKARRPLDMRMDVSLFERTFRTVAPTMLSQIYITASEYENDQS